MVSERWWEKWTWMPTPPTTTLRSRWTCPCRKQRSRYCWHLGDSCLLISLFKNCRFWRIFVLVDMTAKCPLLQKTHTVLQMISLLNYYFTYFKHVAQWQTCNKCDIWCLLTPWPFRFVDEVLQKKVNISLWKPKWITFSLWIG